MSAAHAHTVALVAHAVMPSLAVRALRAVACRSRRALTITYILEGDLAALRLPAAAPQASDPLWQHTCFELFVACAGDSAYYECNFAPSGAWAAYSFEDYRKGMRPVAPPLDPAIRVRRTESRFELEAEVALDTLPAAHANRALELGISAVIEDAAGPLSYWALEHPAEKPDFHDRRAFTLVL